MQEVDLIEHRVNELQVAAHNAGYQLIFGEASQLGAEAQSTYGRRTAIAIKNEYNATSCAAPPTTTVFYFASQVDGSKD